MIFFYGELHIFLKSRNVKICEHSIFVQLLNTNMFSELQVWFKRYFRQYSACAYHEIENQQTPPPYKRTGEILSRRAKKKICRPSYGIFPKIALKTPKFSQKIVHDFSYIFRVGLKREFSWIRYNGYIWELVRSRFEHYTKMHKCEVKMKFLIFCIIFSKWWSERVANK